MIVLASGRKTSRTTALIELCHEAEARGEVSYMICHSMDACSQVFQKSVEMRKEIRMPITFEDFLSYRYGKTGAIKNFFIDDVDKLLGHLTAVHIAAVTILKEETE